MSRAATWTRLAQGDQLQRSSLCVSAAGPTVYIVGGELIARHPRDNDVHKIRLTADRRCTDVQTVPASSNAPSSRVGAATTILKGSLYMFSGRGGEAMAPVDEKGYLWVLDLSTETWSMLPPSSSTYPEPRSYHSMTNDGQDTIYIHAGCPEAGRLSDLWAFSTSTLKWKQLASAPDPPRGGPSMAYANGKIYRMNGFDGKTELGGQLDVFDPSSGTWSSIVFPADGMTGPGARSVAALVTVNIGGDTLLVTIFGESDPSSLGHQGAGKMLSDGWTYSFKDEKWSMIVTGNQDAPDARGWFGADVLTVDGKSGIVVVGGLGASNDRLDDAWLLSFP